MKKAQKQESFYFFHTQGHTLATCKELQGFWTFSYVLITEFFISDTEGIK